ncbi:hypothetical protein LARV_02403 [Longilinea arvoryzae]|uniref:Glycosyltransferase RgtA/B/C/D-like domain-containing protein n=1 Tax=Longilinea arvoryzae TaxID=360412 RepID=A0A0S7BJH5_9CHLR|nr:hypothetical protein [Longilinea arvoryzae]GAP14630.1 hypothetical protein LARV_02403 [Longilinea arvoryzae]
MSSMKKINLWIPTIALMELAACLLASQTVYRIGFPLDDAWIHQTYARNLALHGEFAFLPGVPSAGSTSPLWTILLAVGQWLGGAGVYIWTYLLGFACLAAIALIGEKLFQVMVPATHLKIPAAALLLVTEWHLVWAAASGMETALYCAAILLIFFLAWKANLPAFGLGLLVGVAVWIRPDAITLFGPVGMMLVFQSGSWQQRLRRFVWLAVGVAIPLAGYLAFNYALSGKLWPTTFYAKQAEYAALWQTSFSVRYFKMASLVWVGVGIMLVPGFIFQFWNILKERNWKLGAMMLWWLGYTGIYAYRLPVEYQHGRYLIPAMPVYLLLGLGGSLEIYRIMKINARWKRLFRFAGISATALVALAFLVTGLKTYATDVAIIESEMVDTARWLQMNTAPDDLLAVHDIGAVGYFSGRRMIDLAGLVTPEVVPFMRDETSLAEYLDSKGVDYLVTFPDWYADLPEGKPIVYQTTGLFSPAQGGTNMTVYRWRAP